MPKVKTHSASKKRFRKTGNGLIKRGKAFRRHLLEKKSRKTKRQLRKASYISLADHKNIAKLLPYS